MRVVEMLGERCQIGKAESVHVAKERGLDDGRSRPRVDTFHHQTAVMGPNRCKNFLLVSISHSC